MSSSQSNFQGGNGSKKAVHVKWAGKTIALGTFPAAEADEKCARAKALTRAWRSTMRPKPSREWVMLELERLQVRVVSGRLGRKGGDDDDDEGKVDLAKKAGMPNIDPALLRRDSLLAGRRDSITGLLSAADMAGANRNNSLGFGGGDFGDLMTARRNSSLGMSLLSDDLKRRNSSLGLGGLGTGDGADGGMPPHRPFVGGGSAAAYEAARADHYNNMSKQQERRASGLSLGGDGGMGAGGPGLSVNPNQHYEMLKLHHMNLLNEIQETTLMMNLYQQQQLQQQQQQQMMNRNETSNSGTELMGSGGRLGSIGMGGAPGGAGISSMMGGAGGASSSGGSNANNSNSSTKETPAPAPTGYNEEEERLKAKLRALEEDIERKKKEAAALDSANTTSSSSAGDKRKSADNAEANTKKVKKSGD
uniref:Uncharacterized protein n=1 Tax=Grammatophora oceanica TaxID=210454 RepID=A0A7S1UXA0_9STRA|mmetsp:Transcript_27739/g.40811  ORF Transcript_27739/g.40811 Transcript_27739/m.40811 type:complete len:420 (+) Transcript_27739:266-1525(+)